MAGSDKRFPFAVRGAGNFANFGPRWFLDKKNVVLRVRFDFSILLALYLYLIPYILEKRIKNLKIPIFILSFMNNSLFISQNKSIIVSNTNIFCSYNVISSFLRKFRLIIEHKKTKVLYFSRLQGIFNPFLLDLMLLEGPILHSKNI